MPIDKVEQHRGLHVAENRAEEFFQNLSEHFSAQGTASHVHLK